MPKVLVLGATGGCGSQALAQLLERGVPCTAIVRKAGSVPPCAGLDLVVNPGGALAMTDAELSGHLAGATHVVSCLGHNITLRGVFGAPRYLCADSVRKVSALATKPLKLVVVSTVAVDPPGERDPPRGLLERCVLGLCWLLLPPHRDNLAVVDALAVDAAANPLVDYVAPRPGDMLDGPATEFSVSEHRTTGALDSTCQTTRANVGVFMADLVTDGACWQKWKNTFPLIRDAPAGKKVA
mmetsp:Transcript_27431/g.82336  ORF Transcript_27431/g.82336 Transcript_27431/m.82336 type:complete len:240 (+) Transcript_27431:170-889(+)